MSKRVKVYDEHTPLSGAAHSNATSYSALAGDVRRPLLLDFQNLCAYIKPEKKSEPEKQVLHGISGAVGPGELLAIMGESGSGKTTLLDILGGRSEHRLTGSTTLNGFPRTKETKRMIGFVMQEDIFFPHLTVRETLVFTARLKLSMKLSEEDKNNVVDDVLSLLELTKCANTKIGSSENRGISGGEKRRLNVATVLVSMPSLILLDEPTSGLDSSTALQLLLTLRKLASEGNTVATTIHQPSSRMFEKFDKLLLLSHGQIFYSGPAATAVQFFESLDRPLPPKYNPADFFIELATTKGAGRDAIVRKSAEVAASSLAFSGDAIHDNGFEVPPFPTSFWYQYKVLTQRSFLQAKDHITDKMEFILLIAITAIACALWWRMPKSERTLDDRFGALFFIVSFWSFNPWFDALSAFPDERTVINKERDAGTYRLHAYYLAKCTTDLPRNFLQPTLSWTAVYFAWNLKMNASTFLVSWVVMLLCVEVHYAMGLMISAAFLDFKKSLTVSIIVILFFFLLGGFFVDTENLPAGIEHLKFASTMLYASSAFCNLQFTADEVYLCDDPSQIPECLAGSDTFTGDAALAYFNILFPLATNVGILLIPAVLARTFAYLFLRYCNRPRRNIT